MTRKKHRGDAPRGGRGRGSRGRGGSMLSHGIDFSENRQHHHSFSLADEAKNTERHHGNYAASALRHSRVTFVAAGHLEPSDLLKPLNINEIHPQTEKVKAPTDDASEGDDKFMTSDEDSPIEPSTGVLPQDVNMEKLDLDPPEKLQHFVDNHTRNSISRPKSQTPVPETQTFVTDIIGDPALKPKHKIPLPVPVARSPSPARPGSASSSGSEKIVFVPRKMRSGPWASRAHSPVNSRAGSGVPSPQYPTSRAQSPVVAKIVEIAATKTTSVITIDDPDPTSATVGSEPEDIPILENPIPTTFSGRSTQGNKRRRRRQRRKRPGSDDEDAAIEDYIENIAATMRAEASDAATTINRRPLGGENDWSSTDSDEAAEDSDAVNAYKAEVWEAHELADFDNISTSNEGPKGAVHALLRKRTRPSGVQYLVKWEGYETDDATWVLAETLDSSVDKKLKAYEVMLLKGAADIPESSDDVDEESAASDDDEDDDEEKDMKGDIKLARLLQRQEALGITDSDLELNLELDELMDLDPASLRRSQRSQGRKAKKSLSGIYPEPETGFFPPALHLADAYDDFDPMEWDRPSLARVKKPKRKGKGRLLVMGLSDEELEENIQSSWMKDREKKKAQKAEREGLRAEGLLGRGGKNGKKDLKAKHKEGVNFDELQNLITEFLMQDHQNLALPPMDKKARKIVHSFAGAFGLKSKSFGSGRTRFPTLYKTSRSTSFVDEATIRSMMNSKHFLPRPDARGGGSARTRGGPGRGGTGGVVHHREGDIVGASAPEIGVENRGRKMLEKMGYVAGMALGLEGREGIMKPVEAVVKISKAGLG